jgi:dentin sialophosphoprotein (fragment)
MEEKIVSNMTELSEAAEQKFKDIVNNNVTENPEGPNKINEPNTELPQTGSIPDKSVTVDNPFKTDAGILGDNAKLVNPEVKEPTPDTPQEKAVSGVTDEVAAIYVDAKISDAGDGSDNFEEAIKKTEEELDKALQESEGDGNPTFTANGSDSSMDGSGDSGNTGDKEDTGSSDETTGDEGGEGDNPPSKDDTNDEEIEEKYDETDEKKDDSDDEEFNEGKESDETEYKSVTPAPSADTIIDKVDKFTTTDGEKLKDTLPPVVEGTLNGETKEISGENPTSEIVDRENAQTGTIGPADGASEIMEIQKELNILGDAINEGTSGDAMGSDSNIAETGDNGDTAGDKIPDEIGSESDEGDNLEGDEKKDEAPVVEEEIKDEPKDEGETPTEGPSNATSDEVGDIHEPPKIVENATSEGSDKIETDIDLAGTEFEKNVKEFDNIVKLENTDDLGKAYTDESNIVTSGLDEMAAHAESVRAAMKEMGHAGFEGAMINVHTNLTGMEAATSTRDTFDPNGQLFEDIFKNFPK